MGWFHIWSLDEVAPYTQQELILQKILFSLIVTFEGEAGSDYEGLKTNLITKIYDSMEEII
jgi:hypothetical protein